MTTAKLEIYTITTTHGPESAIYGKEWMLFAFGLAMSEYSDKEEEGAYLLLISKGVAGSFQYEAPGPYTSTSTRIRKAGPGRYYTGLWISIDDLRLPPEEFVEAVVAGVELIKAEWLRVSQKRGLPPILKTV
jgi:hypothetical protein